MNQIDIEQ